MTATQDTVERFFAAYYVGDAAATRATITDDFQLQGPFLAAHSAEEFLHLAKGLMKIVRGHQARRWVIDGTKVAVLYDILIEGPAGVKPLTTGGWFTVAADRLASAELIYDNAAFDAILAPA